MSGIHSRRKGKNGELEACKALEDTFGFAWRRTAQRWGKAKADVEPLRPGVRLHVEVKRYVGGLKYWTKNVERRPDQLYICDELLGDPDSLYFCGLANLRKHADQKGAFMQGPRQGSPMRWMHQAVRDCEAGMIPLVLCRQDHGPWIMAWRYQDDDRLWCEIRRLLG